MEAATAIPVRRGHHYSSEEARWLSRARDAAKRFESSRASAAEAAWEFIDLLVEAHARWGRPFLKTQAEPLGLSFKTLEMYTSLGRHFPARKRLCDVSPTVHLEVQWIPDAEAQAWLKWYAKERPPMQIFCRYVRQRRVTAQIAAQQRAPKATPAARGMSKATPGLSATQVRMLLDIESTMRRLRDKRQFQALERFQVELRGLVRKYA